MFTRNIPPRKIQDIPPLDISEDTPLVTPQVIHRLSPQAYQQLEKQVDLPRVTHTTTDIQAAFFLGQQHVLRIVREGFTVG